MAQEGNPGVTIYLSTPGCQNVPGLNLWEEIQCLREKGRLKCILHAWFKHQPIFPESLKSSGLINSSNCGAFRAFSLKYSIQRKFPLYHFLKSWAELEPKQHSVFLPECNQKNSPSSKHISLLSSHALVHDVVLLRCHPFSLVWQMSSYLFSKLYFKHYISLKLLELLLTK